MSRKDLATTPETINQTLSSFEREGYLTQKGYKKIIIHDIDQLLIDV